MRKRSGEEGVSLAPTASSFSDRVPSASSDSGLSGSSQGRTATRQRGGPEQDKGTQGGKTLPGLDFAIAQPLLEVMAELAAIGRGEAEVAVGRSGLVRAVNGEASSSGERETDILDDEDRADDVAASASDKPSSSGVCSLSTESLPEPQRSAQAEYSTHCWVRRQQTVDAAGGSYFKVDEADGASRAKKGRPPPLAAPDAPLRGTSSREAVQRGLVDEDGMRTVTPNTGEVRDTQPGHNAHNVSNQEEDLTSLNIDFDESMDQLNQLILELDPTYVPVLTHSASLQTNGLSHKGNTHLSGNNIKTTHRRL